MSNSDYLVAIALYSQSGARYMPINGKSISVDLPHDVLSEDLATKLSLELYTRIWKKSDTAPIQRINLYEAIFIFRISMDVMNESLPLIKSKWIKKGDNRIFIEDLKNISKSIWTLDWERYKGLNFLKL